MNSRKPAVWPEIVAVVCSGLLIGVIAFQWNIIDLVTPFLMIPIIFAAYGALGISALISLGKLVLGNKRLVSTYRPLTINVIAFLLVFLVPFTNIWLRANFLWYESAREKIVQQVNTGELYPNVDQRPLIALGNDYPYVSMGGNEIIVEEHDGKKYVFFFTYRGILDNYSGFLYVPEDGDPTVFSDLNEEDSTQLIQYRRHWYFAAHT